MGEVVDLHGQLAHLEDNQEFIADCCRFAENILSEAASEKEMAVRRRHLGPPWR